MIVDVVVAAGGQGRRLGGAVAKQWLTLGDRTIFERSVAACAASPRVRGVVAVVPAADLDAARVLASAAAGGKLITIVAGGARRQDSVAAGLAAVGPDVDVVLVHDAARPFVTDAVIDRVIDATARTGVAIAAARVHDTVKHVSLDGDTRWIDGTIPREDLALAQTPQGFRRDVLDALLPAMTSPVDVTDEASLAERLGHRVQVVEGHPDNVKITTEDDLARARRALGADRVLSVARIGIGYDSHRFADGRRLVIGGVHVPDARGLAGHSDGDAVCHAVTDAVLGAANLGDVGGLFPDTDPAFKDADSLALLRDAFARVQAAGWRLGNLDLVVICHRPKIGRIADALRASLAGALASTPDRISVKGKTPEGTSALEDAMIVHAVALLER
ncbi:bifunctional enzyme IspD/IspF [Luteitalea sp. TBR-22]|uniref:2-C-methyl-D-erythritol 4-phosphate cytidylyltransferase n=1 Tax=Luteitalea sp. TBR-22 TaxID=2802971 RepID=UPI001AFBFAD9|nr:2-C-methyl-D-erythritol 4-phosphate cytidylyltransferase [Luteitalea sp. TBR-22]BCS34633.1 bifunctional enzyme IspD/IspF [Luteitalea sp. TBR-22]